MINRTTNKNHINSRLYFGKLDDESWRDFRNFLADMGEPSTDKHTLDRIDGTKGYSKDNCRWATWGEQMRNTTRNVNLTYGGKTQCVCDWADELKISRTALAQRIRRGWSIEDAFNTPVSKSNSRHAETSRKLIQQTARTAVQSGEKK